MIVEKFERMHPAHHDKATGTETRPIVILQMPPAPTNAASLSAFSMRSVRCTTPTGGSMRRSMPP